MSKGKRKRSARARSPSPVRIRQTPPAAASAPPSLPYTPIEFVPQLATESPEPDTARVRELQEQPARATAWFYETLGRYVPGELLRSVAAFPFRFVDALRRPKRILVQDVVREDGSHKKRLIDVTYDVADPFTPKQPRRNRRSKRQGTRHVAFAPVNQVRLYWPFTPSPVANTKAAHTPSPVANIRAAHDPFLSFQHFQTDDHFNHAQPSIPIYNGTADTDSDMPDAEEEYCMAAVVSPLLQTQFAPLPCLDNGHLTNHISAQMHRDAMDNVPANTRRHRHGRSKSASIVRPSVNKANANPRGKSGAPIYNRSKRGYTPVPVATSTNQQDAKTPVRNRTADFDTRHAFKKFTDAVKQVYNDKSTGLVDQTVLEIFTDDNAALAKDAARIGAMIDERLSKHATAQEQFDKTATLQVTTNQQKNSDDDAITQEPIRDDATTEDTLRDHALKQTKSDEHAVENKISNGNGQTLTHDGNNGKEASDDVYQAQADEQLALEELVSSLDLYEQVANGSLPPTPIATIATPAPSGSSTAAGNATPLMAKLTPPEKKIVLKAAEAAAEAGSRSKLTFYKGLTAHDFGTLLPGLFNGDESAWLNDNIVNEYIQLLVQHIKTEREYVFTKPRGAPTDAAPPVDAFVSQWYTSASREDGMAIVKRWATKKNLNGKRFLDCELVLFPICDHSHWRLVAVKPQERLIEYFDSLKMDGTKYTDLVLQYIETVLNDDLKNYYVEGEWTISQEQKSTKQENARDCGVFAILNALVLLRGEEHRRVVASDGMNDERLRVAASLLSGKLTTEMD